jgi:hypothetical protein
MRGLPLGLLTLLLVGCGSDSKLDRINHPPVVGIDAPLEGEVFRQGEALIALVGTVADTYDDPPELAVMWAVDGTDLPAVTADAEGAVSADLDGSTLEIGTHTVELSATDSDDETTTASVTFEIAGPLGPPTVEITAPDDGSSFGHGESITFVGIASDETTPADDLTFAWSDDVDGALDGAITGGGQSAVLTDALSIGEHNVTLSVTDGDGEVGTDTIHITVEDDTPIPPEPGDLIFTEFMVNPEAVQDEDGEWVELYNTSGSTLDIQGYSFHDDGADIWVFDASIQVEAHGYIVLCANIDPSVNGGVPCDGWFYRNPLGETPSAGWGHGSGVAIANNDDELELTSPGGVDIDKFDYDDTDSDPIEAGMSFGLDPERLDGDLNDDIANWCVQTTILDTMIDPGTPGTPNDSCGLEPL